MTEPDATQELDMVMPHPPAEGEADADITAGVTPQSGCSTCGTQPSSSPTRPAVAAPPRFVYAIGRIEARFPTISAEKEFAQGARLTETTGRTDQQVFHEVLTKRENRYLARQMCWVMTIQGMESYLVAPRDPVDLDLLVEAIKPATNVSDIDVVIGVRGGMAPPEVCNGLVVPIVIFDQIYSFDRSALIKAIPVPADTSASQFAHAAEELFDRIMQLTDNAGATDEHRALNYLTMRYPAIYAKTAERFALDFSLTGVEVRFPAGRSRKLVDVLFAYTNRNTDFTEKFFVRVDVTEEFPFLVTKMSPYYDR
jgi:PatG Domain